MKPISLPESHSTLVVQALAHQLTIHRQSATRQLIENLKYFANPMTWCDLLTLKEFHR